MDKNNELKIDIQQSNYIKWFKETVRDQEYQPLKSNELDSICGVSDDEFLSRFKDAIRIENEISRIKGLPVTGYDYEKRASYIEYPDGRRIYGEET